MNPLIRPPRWLCVAALAPLALTACISKRVPGPNPGGLAEEARTLQYVVDQRCLPYVLGAIDKDRATGHVTALAGRPFVSVGQTSCSVVMNAGAAADYPSALHTVFDRRLGPAAGPDAAARPALPSLLLTGCRGGVHYAYYEERGRFHVEIVRSGCGSGQPQAAIKRGPNAPEQTVAVADLLGLTPGEVRQRLRASAPNQDYVTEIRLVDGALTETRDSFDMTRAGGLCASDSAVSFLSADGGSRPASPRFMFRDGRLTDIQLTSGGGSLQRDQTLDILCRARSHDAGVVEDVVGFAIFAPWIAATAAGRIPETVDRAGARADLARLKLGEPPPGGLGAYASKPPANVHVDIMGPGQGRIVVDLGRGPITNRPALVQAEVVDGRIVALAKDPDNFAPCWTEGDRVLNCGATAAPL